MLEDVLEFRAYCCERAINLGGFHIFWKTLLITALATAPAWAVDPFPAWNGSEYEVLGVWNSEGSSPRLIVRDFAGHVFRCRADSSRSFSDVLELADCKPIITREAAQAQHARNIRVLSSFIISNIPVDVCGVEGANLGQLLKEEFRKDGFGDEFRPWTKRQRDKLLNELIEDLDGIVFVEGQLREGQVSRPIRVVRAEFENQLDAISVFIEGRRVLVEGACPRK